MKTATDFDSFYAQPDPWRISRAGFRDRVLRRCVSGIVTGKSVLELGCGEGHLTSAIFSTAASVTGVDLSGVAIDRARSFKISNAIFRQSDFLSMSFEGHDVIAAIECLYYLTPAEQEQFFEKVAREHSGGTLILSAPIIGSNQHRKYFTNQELVETFTRHRMAVTAFHNININRITPKVNPAIAAMAAALTRLPFTGWLLDAMPDDLIYQRCYIAKVT